jgi:electron transport complex protein RnfB
MADCYERLAQFLDELPAGYPATESGVELRILRKLFTPAEAELFQHLSLVGESPRVVAYRAGLPLDEATRILEEMELKGFISGERKPGKAVEFSVNQFVVGFWEEQVDHLDRELIDLVEEYFPHYFKKGQWAKVPQLRTIPIGESIPIQTDVMPYERAEQIVRSHTRFAVRNCICRQEFHVTGKSCGKPMETCLSFDSGADQTVFTGRGRMISQEDALAILKQADEAGLVLQPANSQDPIFICACCGCCCGVLRVLKQQAKPASMVANPFIAHHADDLCSLCGLCTERCQMEAITLAGAAIALNLDRCIGCGLCVSTCPSGALSLVRKPAADQPAIPKDTLRTYLRLGRARGKLSLGKIVEMVVKSRVDRLVAPR